jgi:hypothetical protein
MCSRTNLVGASTYIHTHIHTCVYRFVVDSLVDSVERHVQSEQLGALEQEVATLQQTLADMQAAADVSDKMFADATALVQEKDELAQSLKVEPCLFEHKTQKRLYTREAFYPLRIDTMPEPLHQRTKLRCVSVIVLAHVHTYMYTLHPYSLCITVIFPHLIILLHFNTHGHFSTFNTC